MGRNPRTGIHHGEADPSRIQVGAERDAISGLGEYLAERGVVMVTLNFRHGPDGYPTTLQDINYGVRWVKAHAKELKAKPDQADARYLLGKILLSQGAAAAAAEQLEAAARLRPEDAGTHYQLGQAYQKLGRAEQAQQQFELFRQLKAKR